ncbi:spermidine synthase [Methylobacterium aquaticum]|uniref:Parallel beta-helix repeat-containing protein n=1 Tax=Methylobacterium aquaticum TaxID=270351 RepID=A0A0J6SIG8_9HYPH|nr:parallel beta-helix repeat-containing protein [Methylobacterium aquaticum]KMO33487.1 parallel beta-helix repeat-containing protein [Methylobacterium aquaticum]
MRRSLAPGAALAAWTELETGPIPGGGRSLRLVRRDDEYLIVVDGMELMGSHRSGSERELAALACAGLRDRAGPRVLIGGLGMGFTLRAALAELGPDATIVVAELVPAVLAWARGPLAHVFGGCLDDPRVEIREADVNRVIQSGPRAWDALLLDVDNGPRGLVSRANDRLYDAWGLKRAFWALRPGGVLAVWSGCPDRAFKARLKRTGFAVVEHRLRSERPGRTPHVVWIATRPADHG